MNKIISTLLFIFVGVGLYASATDNHTCTVTASAINEASVVGGNVTVTINAATAGSNPTAVTDSTTSDLNWTTNEASKKIAIKSSIAVGSQTFTLKATATNISGGTAESQVSLTDSDQDFITAISTTVGTCDLSYEGTATAAEGTGSDAHTITYTLTAA